VLRWYLLGLATGICAPFAFFIGFSIVAGLRP
jgi:hypothetical protein